MYCGQHFSQRTMNRKIEEKMDKIVSSISQIEKSIGIIAELVADPSFKTDIVRSAVQKLNVNGEIFVSRTTFETLINDLILLLDRITLMKDSKTSNLDSVTMELQGILLRNDVTEVKTEKYHPCLHRIVKVIESTGDEVMIVDVIRKGFVYRNKVLRPADVVVKAGKNVNKKGGETNESKD